MNNYNKFLGFLFALFSLYGCANKVTPTGGIRDVEPPQLLEAAPENRSTSFSSRTIELTFNEYVQLKDIGKQLVISPPIAPAPVISVKKKSVIIEIETALRANATYSISFGNSIVDNNEANPVTGFRYIFSTGTLIDSLVVTGQVTDAKTLKPAKDAVVILYDALIADTLLFKKSPDYFSKTDSSGHFQIENIVSGNYKIYALADKNSNYLYDNTEEYIGFVNDPFELNDSAKFNIHIFKQAPETQSVKNSSFEAPGKLTTVFTRPVKGLSWKFEGPVPIKVMEEYSSDMDTVIFYGIPSFNDSIKIIWFEQEVLIDTSIYILKKSSKSGKMPVVTTNGITFFPVNGASLTKGEMPAIKWNFPIADLEKEKISVQKDSLAMDITCTFDDSVHSKISLNGLWMEGNYLIRLLPGAITDVYGGKNDSIISAFVVPSEKTTGGIYYTITSAFNGNKILQVVNEKDESIRSLYFNGDMKGVFEGLVPGTYRLKIINDQNQNGKWDSGDFRKALQPEEVLFYIEPITVRANWEVEINWNP